MLPFRSGLSFALALLLGACGAPPPPANMPPPLPASAYRPVSQDPYSGLIEPTGGHDLATAPVGRGETLIKVPFRYRTTAILTEDVKGFSITVGGTLAPAGAPGYFAGGFSSLNGGIPAGDTREMWCFFRPDRDSSDPRDPICLLRDKSAIAAIAPTRLSPYLWTSFSPMTGTFDYAHTPIFQVQAIDLPVALTLDYRFAGWDNGIAEVELFIRDKEVRTLRGRVRADGGQVIDTLAGELSIRAVPGQPDRAEASLAPYAKRN